MTEWITHTYTLTQSLTHSLTHSLTLTNAPARALMSNVRRGQMLVGGSSGNTALIEAAQGGHVDCVRLLLEAGADKDSMGRVRCRSFAFAALLNDSNCQFSLCVDRIVGKHYICIMFCSAFNFSLLLIFVFTICFMGIC
jgi:hypothetical protein